MSSTVASTKQSVIMLQTRSVDILSRSDTGGVIDFSGQHHDSGGVRSTFSPSPRFDRFKRVGNETSSSTRGRSSFSSSSRGGGSGGNAKMITGLRGARSGSVPDRRSFPYGVSFGPRSISSDAYLTPKLATVSEDDGGEAPVLSGLNRADTEPASDRAHAGQPAAERRGRRQSDLNAHPAAERDGPGQHDRNVQPVEGGQKPLPEEEKPTAAGRIGEFMSGLPLSKLKIVIGK